MNNTEHFGKLTERMQAFREEVLDAKPYIDAQRAVLATEAYKENQNQPRVMVRALMLQKILEGMSIYIDDKSLIAGNQATKNKNAPIFPEYTMEFVMNELDLFEKRDGDVFYITEETKEQLREIAPFWENNNLRARGEALLPEEVDVFMETGVFGMEGKLNAGDAHLAVNYQRILSDGLKGYEKRVKELRAALDFTDPESIDKNVFYKAVLTVIEAVRDFAQRYSKLAKELADKETDAKRKEELLQMSKICAKVPYEPANSFREAVQSVWFIQLILQIESNGHSLSYGRFDQYMYPYYMKDINEGKITKEDALELLTCLWIKTLTINKVRSQSHTLSSAGSPMYQNVTIGGQTTDKKDAVNELSFVVLQSVAQTRLTQPNLTVRYHANIDKHFFDECIEVMKLGFGMPALNNDEIIIPSFINWGVKEEDAYNYSAIGCVETAVPGKWGYRCTGMSYINFPRVLLCAMNDGVDLTSGKRFTKGYGKFTEMETYEDLLAAWDKTVREMTRYSVIVENAIDKASERDVPDVLCSALTDDCIGRGKTIKEGGAVYDFISGLQVGIANMADSLAAIKKLVYEEKKITKEQLWNVAKENTKRLLPAECFGMNFAVYELLSRSTPGEHDRENLLRRTWHIHEELELPEKDKMYVLSNKLKNYGAACIAYPYILDMLAGVLKENFYVLPSSVHEVIIVPESSQIRQSELERMVREINETQVPEEEILSNHAYFYYAQEGKLQLGKEMCINREENE